MPAIIAMTTTALNPEVILSNRSLHHGTGLAHAGKCDWCHDFDVPYEEQIRTCESCHGPESLHSIQADSLNQDNLGTIVVGLEDPGYGHVGHNDDCWGCHGFEQSGGPFSGPVSPTIYTADHAVIRAGTENTVILTGSAFTNITGGTMFESDVVLTASDGSSVTLTPDMILEHEALAVTIPGDMAPGNYRIQASKPDGEENPSARSNPVVVSVIPVVTINNVSAARGTVTITGSGFGGYAKGSGTAVVGTTRTRNLRGESQAKIISWSDTRIKANFGSRAPSEVTVRSVFGTDTASTLRTKRSFSGAK